MPDYRRTWHPGGTYFFTVNALERHGNDLLKEFGRAYPCTCVSGRNEQYKTEVEAINQDIRAHFLRSATH
jgi:hypothetical protein